MADTMHITMLGGFAIRQGEHFLDDQSNRMRKIWLLLAYMVYNRNNRSSPEQYLALLQGSKSVDDSEDPSGKLKALFYRARALLDALWPGAGHNLIVRKNGTYCWNTQLPIELDTEVFDRLRGTPANSDAERLALLLQALDIFRGDFLPKLSMEPWVMPIHAYYHQAFLDVAMEALVLLEASARWEEAEALCHKGISLEPYSEELYQHLMRCRLAVEDREGVLRIYSQMSELLFDTFGVMPSDESRALYREATKLTNEQNISIGTVREQLREPEQAKGAMFCEYDFFRLLYQVQARAIIRSGEVIHIALLTLHSKEDSQIQRRSLDKAMERLKELVVSNLRQGDVVSVCSPSQLVIMLPQANYENSCAVCQRIIRAFTKQYPHSPAQIRYAVHPLEPMIPKT